MKARIFVVDNNFMKILKKQMEINILIPEPKSKTWYKTLTSIMADVFQLQLGDYIFFWEKKGNKADSYIWGVYRVVSNPYFDNKVFKIKIEIAYDFSNPITEYDVLNDPYNKIDLWNIYGKKIAGKSRASTPLSPYEIEFLIQKLIDKNPNFHYIKYNNTVLSIKNELSINFSNTFDNPDPSPLSELDISKISFLNPNGTVKHEKFMELIFNYLIKNNNTEILNDLNINLNNIYWYANYLPYSLERKEIDYLIMEAQDGNIIDRINVIEFQRGTVDVDHINRCLLYSKWINSKLAKGANLSRPIIICEKYADLSLKIEKTEELYKTKKLEIFTINFNNNTININKRR